MWLVLCDAEDRAAHWAAAGLRERGLDPLELVDAGTLTRTERSTHRIEEERGRGEDRTEPEPSGDDAADGDRAGFELTLPDGRDLASDAVHGVVNRLTFAPLHHLRFASYADTAYAMAEWDALVLSWLQCLAPVTVNRPSPLGLSGTLRSPAEWTVLAAAAGLAVSPLRLTDDIPDEPPTDRSPARTLVVLGDDVYGVHDGESLDGLSPACLRLARSAEADLLGIRLEPDAHARHGARFAGATLLPDLRIAGAAMLDGLHAYLTRLPARSR
ncbi:MULTISPECIES: hypothetical protein [Streptomyces]|uniref:Uncharacterized protein n=1 Tax=Streptomyces viridochromogenes TaxID=1938 RepID=A0A0L8JFX1_STRVR|nr:MULTISPECIES: hypothetical protein [Streptomyces]KOG12516.1 hypothetical protein ADK34_32340 [Streptomyces viridochromogenes]